MSHPVLQHHANVYIRRNLSADVKEKKQPTKLQIAGFQKARLALRKRIANFRKLQQMYMPGLRGVLADPSVLDDAADSKAEDVNLFMPSELSSADRLHACVDGTCSVEARVREAATYEALDDLRRCLRTRTYLNKWRVRNISGQRMSTRARSIQHTIQLKVLDAKVRYRHSRHALLVLQGGGPWEKILQPLRDEDIRALNERVMTDLEKAQREHRIRTGTAYDEDADEGIAITGLRGDGQRTLSWIWYLVSNDENSQEMIEGKSFHSHHLANIV